jgi:hypothetical protein
VEDSVWQNQQKCKMSNIDTFESINSKVSPDVLLLLNAIEAMDKKFDSGMGAIQSRLDRLDTRMDTLESHFDRLDGRCGLLVEDSLRKGIVKDKFGEECARSFNVHGLSGLSRLVSKKKTFNPAKFASLSDKLPSDPQNQHNDVSLLVSFLEKFNLHQVLFRILLHQEQVQEAKVDYDDEITFFLEAIISLSELIDSRRKKYTLRSGENDLVSAVANRLRGYYRFLKDGKVADARELLESDVPLAIAMFVSAIHPSFHENNVHAELEFDVRGENSLVPSDHFFNLSLG